MNFISRSAFIATVVLIIFSGNIFSQSIAISGPVGSGKFGKSVTTLPNGNIVVTDPDYDNGAIIDAGAVYLYHGSTHQLISTLKGGNSYCHIGSEGITVLPNGHYVVNSPQWNDGVNAAVTGAITWCSATTGVNGTVNAANSMVGFGFGGAEQLVTVLGNSNFVVSCINWGPSYSMLGAVTWCNGNGGTVGVVSSSNSLVGSAVNGQVGTGGVKAIGNGNYVAINGSFGGSVQWCNGSTATTGVVSSSNALITNWSYSMVYPLTNGNYVVVNETWNDGVTSKTGAVTWCNGNGSTTGTVSNANSLTQLCEPNIQTVGVFPLSNGNYVVTSPFWNNAGTGQAGAAVWCNGTTGRTGTISTANALVGTSVNDNVGSEGVLALPNGHYVVGSPGWNGVGAATWCDGTTGRTGAVNSSNSLTGTTAGDGVGTFGDIYTNPNAIILSNGNYVLCSPFWNNGSIADAGAVTWCNANGTTTGAINPSNSLVGSKANDQVGYSMTVLSNGNYVVCSPQWDNGSVLNTGAVTWCNGNGTTTGAVSTANSLTGTKAEDRVGTNASALANGNYVVASVLWDNGSIVDAGAVTWCNGTTATTGVISISNSLVGSKNNDMVGYSNLQQARAITAAGGNYILLSDAWDNGSIINAGAATAGNGSIGTTGSITTCNSIQGAANNGGGTMTAAYNNAFDYMIAGLPAENKISIFYPSGFSLATHLDNTTVNISGNTAAPLVAVAGCRIIASLKPSGASPVSGVLTGKVWVESTIPYYNSNPFVQRHYDIIPASNAADATGTTTLYFTQQEFDLFNNDPGSALNLPSGPLDATGIANLRVGKFVGTSNNASGLPSTYGVAEITLDPDDADITWNNRFNRWEVTITGTGFGGFIVHTVQQVLPLSLLYFNGRMQDAGTLLNWKTTNEINTRSFEIERSMNGTAFSKIAVVNAANSSGEHLYNYTDNDVLRTGTARIFYRLKMTDTDGGFTYSNLVVIHTNVKNTLNISPNPVENETTLSISSPSGQTVQVNIFEQTGRIVQTQQYFLKKGYNSLVIRADKLSAGIYYIQVAGKKINERQAFIKQ